MLMSVVCKFKYNTQETITWLRRSAFLFIYLFIYLIHYTGSAHYLQRSTFKQFSRKLLFVLFITSHKVARNAYAMETSGAKIHL